MKKKSRPRLYIWLVILASMTLAVTLTVTSVKIIRGGKSFTQVILEENKTFVVNTLRFGHGVMAQMGARSYESLIDLALQSKFIRFLAILDGEGKIIAQSALPSGLHLLKTYDPGLFKDGAILEKKSSILLISYRAKREVVPDMKHKMRSSTFKGRMPVLSKPSWFLVGLDTSGFKKHYRDIVIQTLGTAAAFLLLGILIIIFFGIIQRYELAHLSIVRLQKIKRVMGYFVPRTAQNIIEKDPGKKGLLDKYVYDASILFLDIEGFTLLQEQYSQERINRTVESYFSSFFNLIQKNRGDINETAGDGMMVIFQDADPVSHAQNAVQTALEIQDQCLNTSANEDPDRFNIRVNIGIHSGRVYLGSTKMIGSGGERWTFTASGAVTILAARLSQYARGGQILIGEETAKRVENFFSISGLGKLSLKNIKDSGEVYEISSAMT